MAMCFRCYQEYIGFYAFHICPDGASWEKRMKETVDPVAKELPASSYDHLTLTQYDRDLLKDLLVNTGEADDEN